MWFRLPKLPLHCWGEESLNRIIGAIGVPLFSDDCTSKQLCVSYARVLVEVDITKPVAKQVHIRDITGKDFTQLVMPEWYPYFCSKCHKVGHVCKENKPPTEADTGGVAHQRQSNDITKGNPREEESQQRPTTLNTPQSLLRLAEKDLSREMDHRERAQNR